MNKQDRNKRLGQYFTSLEVAKLLTELALAVKPKTPNAIDPMMGEGVFLDAINQIYPDIDCSGIEIDTTLQNSIRNKFSNRLELVFGNAFSSKVLDQVGWKFHLVITNPPYVRHLNQTTETTLEKGLLVPSGAQVRHDLVLCLKGNLLIKETEKDFLLKATEKYSGLSDLSVPSIIQCCGLTQNEGVLALVIPESCISREYSITTLNVLFKLFDIKAIVKDEGRNWFDNAQVKTLLIVGKKLSSPRKDVLQHPDIPVVEIPFANPNEPLGKGISDYKSFAQELIKSKEIQNEVGRIHFRSAKSFIASVLSDKNIKLYPEFESLFVNQNQIESLDPRLNSIIGYKEYLRLYDMSVDVNQGLRTGANKFFYCDLVKEGETQSLVSFKIKKVENEIHVPNEIIKPVLRKQKEILSRNLIARKDLNGRLIDLKNNYTSSDIAKYKLDKSVHELPKKMSEHIDRCSTLNIGTEENPKYFPELSAVRTNTSTNNGIIKTWYQIPELKDRHLPDICIPRVNSSVVKPLFVEKGVVVDANFITINVQPSAILDKYGLFALLNSDWTKVQLELYGNVLGGGALKLDRTHLQNLTFPKDLSSTKSRLEELGKKLISTNDMQNILADINKTVNSVLCTKNSSELRDLLKYRITLRNKNA
jgi:hypothetical protein